MAISYISDGDTTNASSWNSLYSELDRKLRVLTHDKSLFFAVDTQIDIDGCVGDKQRSPSTYGKLPTTDVTRDCVANPAYPFCGSFSWSCPSHFCNDYRNVGVLDSHIHYIDPVNAELNYGEFGLVSGLSYRLAGLRESNTGNFVPPTGFPSLGNDSNYHLQDINYKYHHYSGDDSPIHVVEKINFSLDNCLSVPRVSGKYVYAKDVGAPSQYVYGAQAYQNVEDEGVLLTENPWRQLDIVVDGQEAVTWPKEWDKHRFFRIHNLSENALTFTFEGGLSDHLCAPGGGHALSISKHKSKCIRRDSGNYTEGYSHFQKFKSNDFRLKKLHPNAEDGMGSFGSLDHNIIDAFIGDAYINKFLMSTDRCALDESQYFETPLNADRFSELLYHPGDLSLTKRAGLEAPKGFELSGQWYDGDLNQLGYLSGSFVDKTGEPGPLQPAVSAAVPINSYVGLVPPVLQSQKAGRRINLDTTRMYVSSGAWVQAGSTVHVKADIYDATTASTDQITLENTYGGNLYTVIDRGSEGTAGACSDPVCVWFCTKNPDSPLCAEGIAMCSNCSPVVGLYAWFVYYIGNFCDCTPPSSIDYLDISPAINVPATHPPYSQVNADAYPAGNTDGSLRRSWVIGDYPTYPLLEGHEGLGLVRLATSYPECITKDTISIPSVKEWDWWTSLVNSTAGINHWWIPDVFQTKPGSYGWAGRCSAPWVGTRNPGVTNTNARITDSNDPQNDYSIFAPFVPDYDTHGSPDCCIDLHPVGMFTALSAPNRLSWMHSLSTSLYVHNVNQRGKDPTHKHFWNTALGVSDNVSEEWGVGLLDNMYGWYYPISMRIAKASAANPSVTNFSDQFGGRNHYFSTTWRHYSHSANNQIGVGQSIMIYPNAWDIDGSWSFAYSHILSGPINYPDYRLQFQEWYDPIPNIDSGMKWYYYNVAPYKMFDECRFWEGSNTLKQWQMISYHSICPHSQNYYGMNVVPIAQYGYIDPPLTIHGYSTYEHRAYDNHFFLKTANSPSDYLSPAYDLNNISKIRGSSSSDYFNGDNWRFWASGCVPVGNSNYGWDGEPILITGPADGDWNPNYNFGHIFEAEYVGTKRHGYKSQKTHWKEKISNVPKINRNSRSSELIHKGDGTYSNNPTIVGTHREWNKSREISQGKDRGLFSLFETFDQFSRNDDYYWETRSSSEAYVVPKCNWSFQNMPGFWHGLYRGADWTSTTATTQHLKYQPDFNPENPPCAFSPLWDQPGSYCPAIHRVDPNWILSLDYGNIGPSLPNKNLNWCPKEYFSLDRPFLEKDCTVMTEAIMNKIDENGCSLIAGGYACVPDYYANNPTSLNPKLYGYPDDFKI